MKMISFWVLHILTWATGITATFPSCRLRAGKRLHGKIWVRTFPKRVSLLHRGTTRYYWAITMFPWNGHPRSGPEFIGTATTAVTREELSLTSPGRTTGCVTGRLNR